MSLQRRAVRLLSLTAQQHPQSAPIAAATVSAAGGKMHPRMMHMRHSSPAGAVTQPWMGASPARCCSLCAKPRNSSSKAAAAVPSASPPPAATPSDPTGTDSSASGAAATAAAAAAAPPPPQPVAPVPSAGVSVAAPSPSPSTPVDWSSLDTVHLRGMRFFSYHGVYAEETRAGQPFELDVDLSADLDEAAHTDRLGATVNYAAVYECAQTVLTGPPYHHLLESLALRVIDDILRRFAPVQRVAVTLRKPKVAIPGLLDYAGVSLARTRQQRAQALAQPAPPPPKHA